LVRHTPATVLQLLAQVKSPADEPQARFSTSADAEIVGVGV
jgi:hypothetical protein